MNSDDPLARLVRLARRSPEPARDAIPPGFSAQLLRLLRAQPESPPPLAIWQFFAVRALPVAFALCLIAIGADRVIARPAPDAAAHLLDRYLRP